MIRGQMFSRSVEPSGQIVFTSDTYGDLASTNWVVPAGVYSISVVAVGSCQGGSAALLRGGVELLSNYSTISAGVVGGGNGGPAGTSTGRGPANEAGAGGAGGYSGNGGAGGSASTSALPGNYTGNPGFAGSGGGGGGGGSGHGTSDPKGFGGYGGGVGLLGIGVSGAAGAAGTAYYQYGGDGISGSALGGDVYGHGVSNAYGSASGGSLRYKNNIPVTPGETLNVAMSGTSMGGYKISNSLGGVRILWGGGRSYPSNALNA